MPMSQKKKKIIVMEGGRIRMEGTLADLQAADIDLTKFVLKPDEEEAETEENKEENAEIPSLMRVKKGKGKEKSGTLVKEEERGVGDVDWKMYRLYITVGGGYCLLALLLFIIISFLFPCLIKKTKKNDVLDYRLLLQGSTFWMAKWTNDTKNDNPTHGSWYYLGIVCALFFLGAGGVVALVSRLRASKALHQQLLDRMLHAPMYFYDTTPIGRIINRFSRDVYNIDQALPDSWASMLRIFLSIFVTLLSVVIVTPWFVIMVLPLGILYWWVQKYFISTSRELRRISSLMNSPIYSHFSESLEGAIIIRAFGKQDEFSSRNKQMIDADHESYYPSIAANRWLAIRLEFVGNCLIFGAAISCCLSKPSPGWVGVALSTIMAVTQSLNWFVRQKSELEQDIVSVERLQQYIVVPQEPPYEVPASKPPQSWPSEGQIQFSNVYMRYREGLDHVLRGLSFEIKSGEKVGVIGRTGKKKKTTKNSHLSNKENLHVCISLAFSYRTKVLFCIHIQLCNLHTLKKGSGKSSMFLTLLRLVEIDNNVMSSKIIVDGLDIYQIGLRDLRSRISVIPQDPVLFTGTLRSNLDPFKERTNEELIQALQYAHVWKELEEMSEQVAIKKVRDEEKKQQKEEEKNQQQGKKIASIIETKKVDMHGSKMTSEKLLGGDLYGSMSVITEESRMQLMKVEENGGNFSVGQRQLICLARAIVRRSKILLLDEATSAVDPATDRLIQQTIRECFSQNTILAIAHRIDTILDYDKIMILDKGKVAEFDSPTNMLNPDSKSRFVDIVQESFGVSLEDIIKQKGNNTQEGLKDMVLRVAKGSTGGEIFSQIFGYEYHHHLLCPDFNTMHKKYGHQSNDETNRSQINQKLWEKNIK
ncbi:ATP-binding cassette, sub-family C (CFTR/MRP), member 3 [Reticulomyxa filosa]|uniref:ATP-binding cassette, sub-family C (CFTR/MRP), member 3 n=1 Tax=Reticulomyxa filosa TaxID=46433 RepID=X6LKV9_RETFI|nr:ATP-binding cassette, sub-family C (CFTR/MRP), member 3 [Reticulomyxa filosa]|eukprot:ETO01991.1 ATP-binding cassette, sub-family C (CFTR/MRP), member 3 [Reticulomyxa filosa]